MAKTDSIYDPETDSKPSHVPTDDDMREMTGIGTDEESRIDADALQEAETQKGLYNPSEAETDKKSSSSDLKNAEGEKGSLYNEAGDEKAGRFGSLKNGISSGVKANSGLILGGIGGTIGLIVLLVFLLILASSLKIPNLAQNIATLEFTRVTRQFSESATRVTTEALATEATNTGLKNSVYNSLKERYANTASGKKVSETWGKLDNYRPSKVIETLADKNKGGMQLRMNGNQFVGGELNGTTFTITKQGATKYVPVLNQLIDFKKNVSFAKDFTPALNAALKANEIGPIIRGATDNAIRKELGINLIAWNLGKFLGKDEKAARLEELLQKKGAVDKNIAPDAPKTGEISETVQAVDEATAKALETPEGQQAAIDNGGVVKEASTALESGLANTGFKDVLNIVNPLYGIALPICIVYDGSLDKSGTTIDNSIRQSQAQYFYVASGGDQQKNGNPPTDQSTELATAVGALNGDLGDISGSNAYIQAAGGSVNTSSSISAEAGGAGSFTLNDALFNPAIANTLNTLGDSLCPTLTNTYVAVGVGAANLVLVFFTGGVAGAGEKAAATASGAFIKEESTSIFERLVTNIVTKAVQKTSGDLAATNATRITKMLYGTGKDSLKNAVGVAAATVIAKLIVMNRAAQVNSGLAQGVDLANGAQNGGNIHAGEVSRNQLMAGPMLETDVVKSDAADATVIASAQANQSIYDRYLSTHNPTSFVATMAIATSGAFHRGIIATFVRFCASIFKPSTYAMLIRPFFRNAIAATSNTHYGNVQFGWTDAEEKLIDSSTSYLPLENQQILDDSRNETIIAQTYADCFGYTADNSGNLTLAIGAGQPGSLGTLLSTGRITRDKDGNVINTGDPSDCSPENLGPHNKLYGDMVLRWRLARSYSTTLDQLTNLQNVSN